jgi:hypothetical protein
MDYQNLALKRAFETIANRDPCATWDKYQTLFKALFNSVVVNHNETTIQDLCPDIIRKIGESMMGMENAANLKLVSPQFNENIELTRNIEFEKGIITKIVKLAEYGLYKTFDSKEVMNPLLKNSADRRLFKNRLFAKLVDELYRINFWAAYHNIYIYIDRSKTETLNNKEIMSILHLKAHISIKWIIGFIKRNKFIQEKNDTDDMEQAKVRRLKSASMYCFEYVPLLYSLKITDLTTELKHVVLFILKTISLDDLIDIKYIE